MSAGVKRLLEDINLIDRNEKKNIQQSNSLGMKRLSPINQKVVADFLGVPLYSIDPVVMQLKSCYEERYQKSVRWSTDNNNESYNAGYVCWMANKSKFRKYAGVQNEHDLKCGSIQGLYKVSVDKKSHIFARVDEFKENGYRPFGIWMANTSMVEKVFLPLSCLSQPLITGVKLESPHVRYYLNSKVRIIPVDEAFRKKHFQTSSVHSKR